MELSAARDMDEIRQTILDSTDLPVGNVPLYQAFKETIRRYKNPAKLDPEFLFDLMEQQLADGLSFMAIHDSHDRAQMAEMIINCELAEIGWKMGCQTMSERTWCVTSPRRNTWPCRMSMM
jgi:thiamine biosynthesis protein ThiC